jgi:hypothetical protein
MRIAGADSYFDSYIRGEATANHSACFSSNYAVCHDYTLRVLEAPSCLTPTNLAINYTGGTTAEVTWEGESDTYNISVNGTVTEGVTNPYTLENLELATTYEVKVQAVCSETDQSDWSKTVSFTPTDDYTLTVNNGTQTNDYVPVYGYYVDDKSYSQFIIPATNLVAMQWATINEMTFYGSNTGSYPHWDDAQFEVYMAETTETTLSALVDLGTMTKVMNEAHLEISDDKMVVTLDTP